MIRGVVVAVALATSAVPTAAQAYATMSTGWAHGIGATAAVAAVYPKQTCANIRSATMRFRVVNRLDIDIRPQATNVKCAYWSETGNPTKVNGSVVAAGAASTYRMEWQYNRQACSPFTMRFVKPSGREAVAPVAVKFCASPGPSDNSFAEGVFVMSGGAYVSSAVVGMVGQRNVKLVGTAQDPDRGLNILTIKYAR